MTQKPKQTDLLTPPGEKPILQNRDDKTAAAIDNLQKQIANLPAEVQEALGRMGVVLPGGDLAAAVKGEYHWGLRCSRCNDIALYFVGSRFMDLTTGQEYDEPPSYMPISRLPWTQNLPADQIDRQTPKCQRCGEVVAKEADDRFRFERRLVRVSEFRNNRDQSFDRKRVKALMQQLASMPNEVTTADGRTVAINDQVRGHFKAASQWLRENMPGSVEDIQAIDGMFAKEGGLLGALEKHGV